MKKLNFLVIAIILYLIPNYTINAASANITVTANKNRVIVGETVTVTVKISSTDALGSWEFSVVPSNNLSLVNSSFGGLYVVDFVSNNSTKSRTYTYTFKAKSSGSGSVSIKNSSVVGYNETVMSVTNGKKNFTLMTQSELEATYSKNNYLKSLSVDGYELTPKFDKDILEYNLELENGTESITVNATKEDSTASIKGTGKIALNEGSNLIEIIVTAQNGLTKTYKINAYVKELKPIEVMIGNEKYTVIRKKEFMPEASAYFIENTIKINEEDVPSYYNEAASITLVGLKNNSSEAKLYIYDNGTYKLFEELVFNQMYIKTIEPNEDIIPEGYSKTKIDINGKSVLVYEKENTEFYLLYGLNLQTGETNLYKYDKTENTLQRYEKVIDDNSIYYYIIIGMFVFIVFSYILFIILISKNNKKVKKIENTMRIDINKVRIESEENNKGKKKKKKMN